jgi:hypothetical protein
MPRPATGQTPVRHVRIGDEIWEQVEWIADQDDCTLTDVVKTALTEYIAKRRRQERAKRQKKAE